MKAVFLHVAAGILVVTATAVLAQVAGKPAARTDLKAGMQCKIEIARGEPRRVRMNGAPATARA